MNLVTGATGIIGSHVVLQLLKNNEVVIAGKQPGSDLGKIRRLFSQYNAGDETLFKQIRWIDIDVRDLFSVEAALQDVTRVFHCAGFVSFANKDRKKLFEINEKGTRNVVNACLFKKVEALCHVSTIGAINNLDYRGRLDESVFWKTSGRESDYALSKYGAEREVWRGMEEGLNAVIVNPGVALAPGFWDQSSSRIFNNCFKGNRFYTGGSTGYVAAADVAKIMVALVAGKHFANRYILIEDNYPFKTVLKTIHRHFKKPEPSIQASRGMLYIARYLDALKCLFTGAEPVITPALVNAALNRQAYSNEKIKALLDYHFMPVIPLLARICDQYISEH
jgi:nucleoside-diphosphate-sugar epimerase